MYNDKKDQYSLPLPEFELHFEGKLNPENRWIKLSQVIQWEQLEFKSGYANLFSNEKKGRVAFPFRVALGALIIKAKLNITDEETVEQIFENPYLQSFLGYEKQLEEKPFSPSLMVHFRRRLSECGIQEVSENIILDLLKEKNNSNDDDPPTNSTPGNKNDGKSGNAKIDANGSTLRGNKGELIIDASLIPSDIRYPTDIALINEGRETAEKILDTLSSFSKNARPRTYRKVARKSFVSFIKRRKPNKKQVKKARRKQLNYLKRILKYIDMLCENYYEKLSKKQLRDMWVIKEMYRQQSEILKNGGTVEDRIVSIRMPNVRAVVRGKAGKHTEFGPKISLSTFDGFVSIDRLSWNNYNEGGDLKMQVEKYKERYGYYPEVVLADQIYGNKNNRKYLEELGVRFGGKALGRKQKEKKNQFERDSRRRNEVEGRFGIAKRKYGMNRVLEYNTKCAEVSAMMITVAMNLEAWLRTASKSFLSHWVIEKLLLELNIKIEIMSPKMTLPQNPEPVQ